jgi:hypothetical protein
MFRCIKEIYLFKIEVYIESVKYFLKKILKQKNNSWAGLKDKYLGSRCFIVCNGPSLTIDDLNKIKNEYSFTMNSVINKLDLTEWSPTFYGIQDLNVFEKMPKEVFDLKCKTKFISREFLMTGLPIPEDAILFDLLSAGHYATNPHPIFKFAEDAAYGVFDGYSISYSLLQVAAHLGFREIYLLGCDCSYAADPSKQHFAESGHIDSNAAIIGGLQIRAYEKAKQVCDKLGIKVFNATRGGVLEVFPRVDLDDIVNS